MKKFFRLSLMAIVALVSLSLSSCKSDDDEPSSGESTNSKLTGIWYIDQTTYEYYTNIPEAADYYNRTEVEPGDGEYWEFTASKVTVHDPSDLANNKPVSYTYNSSKKELSIMGVKFQVKKLNSSNMVLYSDETDGKFGQKVTIEFSR